MFNVNRVTLLGNVTRAPEAKITENGRHVATISLATNRVWKDANGETKTEPEFHRLICWDGLAEFVASSVTKGAALYAEGRLRTAAGQTEIVADRLVLLSGRKKGEPATATSED